MKIVKIDLEKDYSQICDIWNNRKFDVIPKKVLSNSGFAICDETEFIAFCWLYPTIGSSTCWFSFPTTNPEFDKEVRKNALDILMKKVIEISKDMGYTVIMTTSGTESIIERLENNEFKLTDRNVGLYFRSL